METRSPIARRSCVSKAVPFAGGKTSETLSRQFITPHVQAPFSFRVDVRETPVPVERKEGVADTFKDRGGALVRSFRLSAQGSLVLSRLTPQAAHGEVRPNSGKKFSCSERLHHVIV